MGFRESRILIVRGIDIPSRDGYGFHVDPDGIINMPLRTGWRVTFNEVGLPMLWWNGSDRRMYFDDSDGSVYIGRFLFGSGSLLESDFVQLNKQASGGGYMTPAEVQHIAAAPVFLNTTITQAFANPTVAGNTVIAIFSTDAGTGSAAGTHSTPAGYTLVRTDTNDGLRVSVFKKDNCAAGEPALTCTNSKNTANFLELIEVSGLDQTDSRDKNTGLGGTSRNLDSGTTAATVQSEEYVLGAMLGRGVPFSAPSFGAVTDAASLGSRGAAYTSSVVSAMGTQRLTASQSPSSAWVCSVATFKARALGVFPNADAGTGILYFADSSGVAHPYFVGETGPSYDLLAQFATKLRSLRMFVPADWTLDSGTAVTIGAVPNAIPSTNLANAATQGFYLPFRVPDDWASGAINATILYSPTATDAVAHTIRWQFVTKEVIAGTTDLTAAGTTSAWTGAAIARTLNLEYAETIHAVLTPTAAGNLVQLNVRRLGSDAANTYTGAVRVIGVVISYTAIGA